MCKSHITCRKYLKLILEVLFYNIACWCVFTLTGYESFSLKNMLLSFIPIVGISDGFTSCFLVFYLFIPFLNVLIGNLNRKQHGQLLALCLGVYTILGTIPKFHVVFNYVTWFCILYVISSYIRFYAIFPKIKNKIWGLITLFLMLLSVVSLIMMIYAHVHYGIKMLPFRFVADSNMIFAVLVSISSFMFFKDLHIGQSKIINVISASTFGVLCIHANSDTMRQWLWKDLLDNSGHYADANMYLISVLSILSVFIVCILIDYIRIHSIEKWTFSYIDKLLVKYGLQ